MSKNHIDEVSIMTTFLEDSAKRAEILNNAGNNYLSPENKVQRKFTSELAAKFCSIKKEEINLLGDGAKEVAKFSKDFFKKIQKHYPKPINSQTIVSLIENQDTKNLFDFFQKASEAKIFDKLLSLAPDVAQKSEQFKFNKMFLDQVKLQKTPEAFKKFLMSHLEDPQNKEMLQILSRDLKIALETPGINKLVDIVTDPKSINAISKLANSRAGQNLARVLAKENPSKIEFTLAVARFFATAIKLAPISKMITATNILWTLDKKMNAEKLKNSNDLYVEDMIKSFKIANPNISSSEHHS